MQIDRRYYDNGRILRFIVVSVLVHVGVIMHAGSSPSRPTPLIVPAPELRIFTSVSATTHVTPNTANRMSVQQRPANPISQVTDSVIYASAKAPLAPETTPVEIEPADAGPANHLRTILHEALNRHFIYPPVARRNGWEGKVEMAFSLDAQGSLNGLRVVQSSGYAILDQDAMLTLTRVGSIPQARVWLGGKSYDTGLPVVYKLISD